MEWVRTFAEFHEHLVLAAPIAAASATYYAGRLTGRSMLFSQASASRAGYPVLVRHLRALTIPFTLAYLAGLVPLTVLTAVRAETFSWHVLPAVTGILGLIAAICVGYAVGAITGGSWFSPVVLVLMFAVVQSTQVVPSRFAAVSPVTAFPPSLGRHEAMPLVAYRIAFLLFVIAAVCLIVGTLFETNSPAALRTPIPVLSVLVVIAGVVAPMVWRPAILVADEQRPRRCETGVVRYCVHEGHASRLSMMRAAGDRMLTGVGGARQGVEEVLDAALAGPGDIVSDRTVWVHLYPGSHTDQYTATAIASVTSGAHECARRFGHDLPGDVPQEMIIATALGEAMVGVWGPGSPATPGGPFAERLAGTAPAALGKWLTDNADAVRGCRLTEGMLP